MQIHRILPLAIASVLLGLTVAPGPACKTNESGQTVPDWKAWKEELELAKGTIERALIAFPEKAAVLERLEDARQDALKGVSLLAEGGSTESALDYLEAAAQIASALTEDGDVRFAAFALGEIVARIQFYVTLDPGEAAGDGEQGPLPESGHDVG